MLDFDKFLESATPAHRSDWNNFLEDDEIDTTAEVLLFDEEFFLIKEHDGRIRLIVGGNPGINQYGELEELCRILYDEVYVKCWC